MLLFEGEPELVMARLIAFGAALVAVAIAVVATFTLT